MILNHQGRIMQERSLPYSTKKLWEVNTKRGGGGKLKDLVSHIDVLNFQK